MSKLEELLEDYCPDGVEYKPLKEIAQYGKERVDSSEINSETYVGVDNLLPNKTGKVDSSYVPSEGRLIKFYKDDILIGNIRPYLKKIWLSTCDGGTNGDVLDIHIKNLEQISSKYLFYVLSSDDFFFYDMQYAKGAKMPRGNKDAVMQYEIPVPPLPVQQEIVRILDMFTGLTAELTDKLTAELTARKKQYEYYRNQILTFDSDTPLRALGELAMIVRGASPRPISNFITNDEDGINWIKIGDAPAGAKYINHVSEKITPEGAKKSRFVHKGDFILSNSMSFGRPYILKVDGCIHDGWLSISNFQDYLDSDYLYHILCSASLQKEFLQKASRGGSIKNLNADIVKAAKIPVPSMEIQKKIVTVLNHFDTLCSDISTGLPAEIEARQKQYEYYRDKLLTFKRKA